MSPTAQHPVLELQPRQTTPCCLQMARGVPLGLWSVHRAAGGLTHPGPVRVSLGVHRGCPPRPSLRPSWEAAGSVVTNQGPDQARCEWSPWAADLGRATLRREARLSTCGVRRALSRNTVTSMARTPSRRSEASTPAPGLTDAERIPNAGQQRPEASVQATVALAVFNKITDFCLIFYLIRQLRVHHIQSARLRGVASDNYFLQKNRHQA